MKPITTIKVPVAYKMILGYNEYGNPMHFNSNVYEYNIHPWYAGRCGEIDKIETEYNIKFPHILKGDDPIELHELFGWFNGHNFQHLLDDTYETFDNESLDDLYLSGKNYIYPIILYDNKFFKELDTIELPEKLIVSIINGKAKIVITQPTEGFMGENYEEFIWVNNLSIKYNFKKEDIIFLSSNFMSKERYNYLISINVINECCIVHEYAFFGNTLWFVNGNKMAAETKKDLYSSSCDFIENNRRNKKTLHFLCFNRVPKWHRLLMFGELMSNEKFINKSITTLGSSGSGDNPDEFYIKIKYDLDNEYQYSKKRLLDFYQKYDSSKHTIYDESDLSTNKAGNINTEVHKKTFVNIVTESLYKNKTIFFSEKIFKPIYMCQPFILVGNPNSLKTLKKLGYRTFDKWWDESYDEELDFIKRFEKIITIMEEISTWSYDKCFEITNEMEDVLRHNFNIMMSDSDQIEVMNLLSEFKSKGKEKRSFI
jgi:hypothetical protein